MRAEHRVRRRAPRQRGQRLDGGVPAGRRLDVVASSGDQIESGALNDFEEAADRRAVGREMRVAHMKDAETVETRGQSARPHDPMREFDPPRLPPRICGGSSAEGGGRGQRVERARAHPPRIRSTCSISSPLSRQACVASTFAAT